MIKKPQPKMFETCVPRAVIFAIENAILNRRNFELDYAPGKGFKMWMEVAGGMPKAAVIVAETGKLQKENEA